jgi:saccharopine dehydrogenase-like NADP-dependent oxidoreductase
MYELVLKDNKNLLEEILKNAKPPVDEDVVYVYAVVEGWKKEKIYRSEYFNAFYPMEIHGHMWRAISWTTAASLVAVIEMVFNGVLPQKGFIKQEEIPFQSFLKTRSGQLFIKPTE